MKKKIIGLAIAVIMGIALCACGKEAETNVNQKPKASATVKPTETPKPTEEATDEAVEVSEEAIEVSEEAVSATEEPVTEEQVQDTSSNITELNKTMYATQAVNVRSGPGTSNPQIGSLTKGQAVTVTGQDTNTNWYRIDFNGSEGFVSNKCLSENAVSSNTTASNNVNTSSNSTGNSSNNSDNGNGGGTTNNTPQNNEQSNPAVVEQPTQVQTQPQTEQVTLPDIEQTKADIIATLRAKGCITIEEYTIKNYGQEFWNEYLAESGQSAYSSGMGWFEGRVASKTYWQNINGIASNYIANRGTYWIEYLRTEGNDLIFKCYIAN